jgi:RNA methyltransferase, TrmH family
MTKRISSRHNPLFKRIREAIREHANEIVVEGPKPVADAIANGWKPIHVVTRDVDFSAELFDALTETKNPQHVIGLFERPLANAKAILSQRDRIALALDAVQDPGNVGTIVRLAATFSDSTRLDIGIASAILNVPVAEITVADLIASGVPLFATAMSGAKNDPPSKNAVLVFGNEGAGVSHEVMAAAKTLAIPMSSRVESLNVAASAAILLARSYATR